MTEQEKNKLLESYEKDFFDKTGERVEIKYKGKPEYEEAQKYVNNYLCKYNVILPGKGSDKPFGYKNREADKIHLLRWYLKTKFRLTEKEVAYYTKCDRTNIYNSVSKVNGYLDTQNEEFLEFYNLVISDK